MPIQKFLRLLILGLIALVLSSLPSLALASRNTTPSAPNAPVLNAPAPNAPASSVSLGSSEDNTLYEDPNGSLSNGAGAYFFAGRTGPNTGTLRRRGLIKFDVASSLPPTATIVGVTLHLVMSQTIAGAQPVELHRVTASWGEGTSVAAGEEGGGASATTNDATWLHRFYSSTLWTTPGGDFVITPSATITVGGVGAYEWSTPGMVADVQMWLNSPATNDGWLLLGNEAASGTSKRFDTKENDDPNARPLLVVTYLLLPHKTYLPLVLKQ